MVMSDGKGHFHEFDNLPHVVVKENTMDERSEFHFTCALKCERANERDVCRTES